MSEDVKVHIVTRKSKRDGDTYIEGVFASLEIALDSHDYKWAFTDQWKDTKDKSRAKGYTIGQATHDSEVYYMSVLQLQGMPSNPINDLAMAALRGDPSAIDVIIDAVEMGSR